jgi:hypothetical protein
MSMSRRRFMILLVTLVAVNSFFWMASGGFALTKAVVNQFFGNSMIRAEVLVMNNGSVEDWRIDRGVITQVANGTVTLKEKDGTFVPIPVDANAKVQGPPRFSSVSRLRPRLRVILYHQANLPAQLVQVEGVG